MIGEREVKISKEGYLDYFETVNIEEDIIEELSINLPHDFQTGWPIAFTMGQIRLNVPLTSIDFVSDEKKEILQSQGEHLYVFHDDGSIADGWPFGNSIIGDSSGPVVGDINNDGQLETVALLNGKYVYAFDSNGNVLDGFPFFHDSVSYSTFGLTISLADIDGDGFLDIIVPFGKQYIESTYTYNEAAIFVLDFQGNILPGWPHVFYDESTCLNLIANDIDNNGSNEIVALTLNGSSSSGTGKIYVFNSDASIKTGWPHDTNNWSMWPALADIDNDGDLEIFVSSLDQYLYAYHHDGTAVTGWPKLSPQMLRGAPVIGDIDGDGDLEIIVAGANQYYAYHHDGTAVTGWPIWGEYLANQFPLIVDIDEDGAGEIFLAFNNKIYVYRGDGSIVPGWPKIMDNPVQNSLLVDDLDLDGDMELLVGIWKDLMVGSVMYAWDLDYPYSLKSAKWPMYMHDAQHSGTYIVPPCSDGTPYNECSSNKPIYCDNGELINNCQECGCPPPISVSSDGSYVGFVCQQDGSCLKRVIYPIKPIPIELPL